MLLHKFSKWRKPGIFRAAKKENQEPLVIHVERTSSIR
jgi:hypothetical protein